MGVYGGEEESVSGFVARVATREAGEVTFWIEKDFEVVMKFPRIGMRATISASGANISCWNH